MEVRVRKPTGAGPAIVELFWDERWVATIRRPPYRASPTVLEGSDSGFLRAPVTLEDGRSAEDVLTLGREGFASRLDVDLVQRPAVYDEIARELRHQYLLTYESDREDPESGWRRVEVEALRPGLRVKTAGGYYVPP